MSSAAAKPTVAPTTTHRIYALDFLRGVAILGILLANIPAFSQPFMSEMFLGAQPPANSQSGLVEALTLAFVNGKFRTLLMILFGVGMYLQYAKRAHDKSLWPGGYLKRTLWLSAIGLVHMVFLWFGDILFIYSIGAFITAFAVHLAWDRARKLIGWMLVLHLVFGLGLAGLLALLPTLLDSASSGSDASLSGAMAAFSPQAETAVFAQGSYGEQIVYRLTNVASGAIFQAAIFIPTMMAFMLIGAALARTGVLDRPSSQPELTRRLLIVGIAIGLPLNLLGILFFRTGVGVGLQYFWETLVSPLLAVGYMIAGAVLVEKGYLRPLTGLIATIGRMALSTYLLQSLIATFVFYSWGLGLYGTMDAAEQLRVVAGIWVANAIFAVVWMRFFQMGPVEWLWRVLTEGQKLPIRKGRESTYGRARESA